ncbi:MAG TPA: helix-turn-helix domain-containing protein, partial [Arachidicoccus sp.]|nr:helix-turn-helix domain-containing protein [Arachidicoccus sp.]
NEDLIHIPLILLTAKDTIQSKIQGLKIGADAYIEKPFSSEHLQIQIDNLLRGRVQLKDFYANSPLARVNHGSHVKGNEQFLEEIKQLILDHLDDPDLDVVRLAEMLHMSRPTLYRKIKSLFNLSPNEMIHLIRLTKAAEMIAQDQLRISEVAERVGYKSVGQFGRNFSKQFKMTPSEYMEKVRRAL